MSHPLQSLINKLLSAHLVVVGRCGRPTPERLSQRHGFRHRSSGHSVATLDVAVRADERHALTA